MPRRDPYRRRLGFALGSSVEEDASDGFVSAFGLADVFFRDFFAVFLDGFGSVLAELSSEPCWTSLDSVPADEPLERRRRLRRRFLVVPGCSSSAGLEPESTDSSTVVEDGSSPPEALLRRRRERRFFLGGESSEEVSWDDSSSDVDSTSESSE